MAENEYTTSNEMDPDIERDAGLDPPADTQKKTQNASSASKQKEPDPADIQRDVQNVLKGDPKDLPWKLIKFRSIAGIHTTGTFMHSKDAPRAANNLGIYSRIIAEEKATNLKYTAVNFIIETTYLMQIALFQGLCFSFSIPSERRWLRFGLF